MADSDGALDYALAAMDKAAAVRESGSGATAPKRGMAGVPDALPGLDFSFRSPSFLSGRSRWILFVVLAAAGFVVLFLAYRMVIEVPQGHGAEWIWPPIIALLVAAVTFALAYATVMGFGNVEIKTTVGDAGTPAPDPSKPPQPTPPPKPVPPGQPGPPNPPGPPAPGTLTVTGTVPPEGALGVAPDVTIAATFSAAVIPATATPATFSVRKQDGTAVPATVSLDGDGLTARLHTNAILEGGTKYQAIVGTGLRDEAGHALAAPKSWSFTTAA